MGQGLFDLEEEGGYVSKPTAPAERPEKRYSWEWWHDAPPGKREGLLHQIKRDLRAAEEDPLYRSFHLGRVAQYRATLLAMSSGEDEPQRPVLPT